MTEMILPTAAPFFEWRSTARGPALVCSELESYASHVFTTRHWRLGSEPAQAGDSALWGDVAHVMGVTSSDLVRLRQVHGAAVSEAVAGAEPASADILVTDDPTLAIAVQAADCVPLLLADSRSGAVGAAHAGWRGLAAGAPGEAVNAMVRRYATDPADLIVAVGPSIGRCCYQVGPDVREAFAGSGWPVVDLEAWFLERPHSTPRNPSMPDGPRPRANHWFFDGWAAVRNQLRSAGVRGDRVFSANMCTASHPGALCSYRRDKAQAGRMVGAIRSASRRP